MTSTGETPGYRGRMTVNGSSAIEFLHHDVSEDIEIIQDEGIRGVRSRAFERIAQGNINVKGSIDFEPTPAELAILLPLVTGSSTSATTLTDLLQDVTIVIDDTVKTLTFVARFTAVHFTGEPNKKIAMKLDVIGKTCVVSGGGSLSAAPDITARPYVFYDAGSGITIGGVTYSIDKFALTIDNKIKPTFMQGQTATDLEPYDRTVTLSVQTKYTSTEVALWVGGRVGPVIASPLAASIAFAGLANSITFTFGALQLMSKSVVIPSKDHLRLPLNYQAYKVGTTLEVVPALV